MTTTKTQGPLPKAKGRRPKSLPDDPAAKGEIDALPLPAHPPIASSMEDERLLLPADNIFPFSGEKSLKGESTAKGNAPALPSAPCTKDVHPGLSGEDLAWAIVQDISDSVEGDTPLAHAERARLLLELTLRQLTVKTLVTPTAALVRSLTACATVHLRHIRAIDAMIRLQEAERDITPANDTTPPDPFEDEFMIHWH